jgi:hypothetical protein
MNDFGEAKSSSSDPFGPPELQLLYWTIRVFYASAELFLRQSVTEPLLMNACHVDVT